MGLFSKVKKIGGDIVDGAMKGVSKVFDAVGIDLAKVLNNDWVKGGLLAVSIFTGGVAIANGVMTGFTQATAAQAAQQATAGAVKSSFMDSFIAGGRGFIEGMASGVMEGMANPLDTAGKLAGDASSAMGLGNMAGGQQVAADMTSSSGAAQSMNQVGGGPAPMNIGDAVTPAAGPPPGAWTEASGQMPNGLEINRPDFMAQAPAANPSDYGFTDMADMGGDAMGKQLQMGEQGWMESMANGAKDFASSSAGMMTMANAAQGWAQGSMIEKRWDEMEKAEKHRRKSWTDSDLKTPSYNIPSLQNLRKRTAQMRNRGNKANAKYGYG